MENAPAVLLVEILDCDKENWIPERDFPPNRWCRYFIPASLLGVDTKLPHLIAVFEGP